MMTTATMTANTTIQNIWYSIVRTVGGRDKRIKTLTTTCSGNADFEDTNNHTLTDVYNDCFLVKRSNAMIFCSHDMKNPEILFDADISNIENLYFRQISSKQYVIAFNEYVGLRWLVNIELQ